MGTGCVWLAEVTLSSEIVICRGCGAEKDHMCPVPGLLLVGRLKCCVTYVGSMAGQHPERTLAMVSNLCAAGGPGSASQSLSLANGGQSHLCWAIGTRPVPTPHLGARYNPVSECGCIAQPGERGCGLVALGVRRGVLTMLWGWWVQIFGHWQHQLDQ